jgi:hypothetical protein
MDFWPLNTILVEFWQKIQDGGYIRVVQKHFFYVKNTKIVFFKTSSKSIELKLCGRAFLRIFKNGGTVQDGGFLTFYFQKISKNQRKNIFQFCKLICVGKYSYFMA